jgi:two-component system chemotaxis response regulator CheY
MKKHFQNMAEAATDCATLRVLMVEDDIHDLALFRIAADATGLDLRAQPVAGVEEAIELLEKAASRAGASFDGLPDLVVLDLEMPRMDGFGFLSWRRVSPVFSSLPVILFTGMEDQKRIARAMAMGASRHIAKPLDFEGMKAAIRKIWQFGIASRHAAEPRTLNEGIAETEIYDESNCQTYGIPGPQADQPNRVGGWGTQGNRSGL